MVGIAEAILDYQSYSGLRAETMVMGKAQNSLPNEKPHKFVALIILFLFVVEKINKTLKCCALYFGDMDYQCQFCDIT